VKSTIEQELKKQDDDAYRAKLTKGVVDDLKMCTRGGAHNWTLMGWHSERESRPVYSIHSPHPIGYERTPTDITAEMMCGGCGASISFKQRKW
jgi:hypothetical protein